MRVSYPKVKEYVKYTDSRRSSLFLINKGLPKARNIKLSAGRVYLFYNMWKNGVLKYAYYLPKHYRKIEKDVYGNKHYTRRLVVVSRTKSRYYTELPLQRY